MKTQSIVDWLISGVPGATRPQDVMQKMCDDLFTLGLPIAYAECFVRTLHPHVVGRSFVWEPRKKVEIREQSWTYLQSPDFLASPVAKVFQTGTWERSPLPSKFFSDFVAAPLIFLNGQIHAITFATKTPGGFTSDQFFALQTIVPPLSRIAEIFALSRTAVNLLNTYVGRHTGERILSGRIQRGDIEPIQAILWFSDIRGFTEMSTSLPPSELIRVLNDLFECQVPIILKKGGEVLKFMGDGLLAIFPIIEKGLPVKDLCDLSLDAATEAFYALKKLNQNREKHHLPPLRFSLALHVGEVTYGNIGAEGRLDFTCIGPAVNLSARLEGIAAKLARDIILSQAFSQTTTQKTIPLGTFPLKGVTGNQPVFAPADEPWK